MIKKQIQHQHKVNIDLVSAKKIICECGSKLWTEVIICTKVPALMAGNTQDQLVMVKVLQCVECKKIMPEHLPFLNGESETNKLTVT